MALTKVSRGLLSTGIVDNSNATAITLNADESATFTAGITVGNGVGSQQIYVDAGAGWADLKLNSDATNGGSIYFNDGADAGQIWYYHPDNTMRFHTDGSERVRITSTGVGIGGTPATARLEVTGAFGYASGANSLATTVSKAAARINGSSDASTSLFFGSLTNDAEQYIQSSNGAGSAADDLVLNPYGGNVGISTSTAYKSLTVGNTDATAWITSGGSNVHLTMSPNGSSGAFIVRTGGTNGDPSTTTERARITAAGNLGLGTSSPNSYGGYSTLTINGTTAGLIDLEANGTLKGEVYAEAGGLGLQAVGATNISFKTNYTERMRIGSNGKITASSNIAYDFISYFQQNNSSGYLLGVDTASTALAYFYKSGSTFVGSISTNGSSTSYNETSDQRVKENIQPATKDAGELIDAIQVRQFDWKADGRHQDYGTVAQELISVFPDAVSIGEDPEQMMGVDYSKLVPMLVKEIQSLRARVAQLENN